MTTTPETATTESKPELLKSWQTKLLVLTLCALSFVIGWTSSQHHANKKCQQSGGQVSNVDGIKICKLS